MEDSYTRKIFSNYSYNSIDRKIKLLGSKSKFKTQSFLNLRLVTSIIIFFMILYFNGWGYILAPVVVFLYYFSFPRILDYYIDKRRKKLEKEAIFFFEVLCLAIESGNNLLMSLELTSNDVESELSEEFRIFLKEVSLGKNIDDAIDDLRTRIPSDAINNILINIKLSMTMGNNITETLKNQLKYIREQRILSTKAYISKIPLKISVISVVFFVPLLLLLILGPVLIDYIG